MRGKLGVERESSVEMFGDERRIGPPFRIRLLHDDDFAHETGEAFVEIEIVPPLHGRDVSKPHVGHFVRLDRRDPLLEIGVSLVRVKQVRTGPASDQAPVFLTFRVSCRKNENGALTMAPASKSSATVRCEAHGHYLFKVTIPYRGCPVWEVDTLCQKRTRI
jgi:hypothetical protein